MNTHNVTRCLLFICGWLVFCSEVTSAHAQSKRPPTHHMSPSFAHPQSARRAPVGFQVATWAARFSLTFHHTRAAKHSSQEGLELGILRQSTSIGFPTDFILAVLIGAPYSALTLIPFIGNIVVTSGEYSRGARLAWGVTGTVMGSLGILFFAALSPQMLSAGESGIGMWAISVLTQIWVHIATLILGINQIVRATQKQQPKKFSIQPYWAPEAGGHQRAGLVAAWRF